MASTSPWFMASTRSETLETSDMSCSTISTVMPSSCLDVLDPERHVVGFFHIEAGRGFIEQQQLGLGAQGPRHLHHLAHAVGQAGDEGVAVVLQFEKFDHLLGFFARLAVRPRERRR